MVLQSLYALSDEWATVCFLKQTQIILQQWAAGSSWFCLYKQPSFVWGCTGH